MSVFKESPLWTKSSSFMLCSTNNLIGKPKAGTVIVLNLRMYTQRFREVMWQLWQGLGECSVVLVQDCLSKVDQNEVPMCDLKVNIFSRNPQIRNSLPTSHSEALDSSAQQSLQVPQWKQGLRHWDVFLSSSAHQPSIYWECQVGKDQTMDAGLPRFNSGLLILLAVWPWTDPEYPQASVFHLSNGVNHSFPYHRMDVMRTNGEISVKWT